MKLTEPDNFGCSGIFFLNFIGQNKLKILNKVKICQNFNLPNFTYKNLFLAYLCIF